MVFSVDRSGEYQREYEKRSQKQGIRKFDRQISACNYLPAAAKYFDMGELACLIYLGRLIEVAGEYDPIFPFDGVQKVYEVIKK